MNATGGTWRFSIVLQKNVCYGKPGACTKWWKTDIFLKHWVVCTSGIHVFWFGLYPFFWQVADKILSYCHLEICLHTVFGPHSLLLSANQRLWETVELKWLREHTKIFSVKFNISVPIFQIEHLQACIAISTHWLKLFYLGGFFCFV